MTFGQLIEDRPMSAVRRVSDTGQRRAHLIKVARDFSETPGGRSPKNGPFSGEVFRESVLLPALRKVPSEYQQVIVDLDGTDTYIGSFLEEAFGGLFRGNYSSIEEIRSILIIQATGEFEVFRDLALQYMVAAANQNR